MAVDAINVNLRVTGGGVVTDSGLALTQAANFGGTILPRVLSTYTFGTGNNQVNKWYLAERTLGAGAYDDLDLATGLSFAGTTQVFTALKFCFVGLVTPDGTRRLRVGPQGRTDAAALWFQAVTTNFWEETYTSVIKDRPITGWAIGAGADVFTVHNPGASSVDYAIWLIGTG